MRARNGIAVVLGAVAAFATYGCGGSGEVRPVARAPHATPRPATPDGAGTTSTTSAALTASRSVAPTVPVATSTATAVMRVAIERCERAAACKQVGTGRAYGDRDECVNAVGHEIVAALSDEQCPSGVDTERLAACVSDVRASTCDGGATAASNLPSCARERVCRGGLAEASSSRSSGPASLDDAASDAASAAGSAQAEH